MIYIENDKTVFDVPAQTIVNTVNCDGFMGKGLALEIRKRFPRVFEAYRFACKKGKIQIGTLQLVKSQSPWILNFPTKNHWRGKSKLSYIESGLSKFRSTYRRRGIISVAMPPLGCGHGGLQWSDVLPLVLKYLRDADQLEVFICLGKQRQ